MFLNEERRGELKMAVSNKVELEAISKLSKQIKSSLVNVSKDDIRFCIKTYYQIQEYRIALAGQIRSLDKEDSNSEHQLLDWLLDNMNILEKEIVKAMDAYTTNNQIGAWLKQIYGIGPVLAAGLLSYFDIKRAPSVSHFYSYSGLNKNNVPWLGKAKADKLVDSCVSVKVTDEELLELSRRSNRKFMQLIQYSTDRKSGKRSKTQLKKNLAKPPFNMELQVLLWKIGESFVKSSGREGSLYGKLYKERKAKEIESNNAGKFADQAEAALEEKNYDKSTESYKAYIQGKLPDGQIHARARKYAVKIFVSHLFDEMYKAEYGKQPPRAYVFEHLGHVDVIEPEVPGIKL